MPLGLMILILAPSVVVQLEIYFFPSLRIIKLVSNFSWLCEIYNGEGYIPLSQRAILFLIYTFCDAGELPPADLYISVYVYQYKSSKVNSQKYFVLDQIFISEEVK